MGGGKSGRKGRPVLCQECGKETGEHVTAACRGQTGVTAGIDVPVAVRGGDDAAAALEHNRGTVASGKLARRGNPVGLYFGCATTEQARSLGWVGGKHRWHDALVEHGGEFAVSCDQVERIGVEREGQVGVQRPFDEVARRVAATQSWPDGKCGEVGGENIVGAAQHEFGLVRVDARRFLVVDAQIDAAAAEVQGGTSGEQCGTEHTRRAADDAGAAVAALVRVTSARGEVAGEQGRRDQTASGQTEAQPGTGWRHGIVSEVEPGNANYAAVVGAVGSKQAGLGADEGQGVCGSNAGGEGTAGIGIEAARGIEREQRAGIALGERIGCLDQCRVIATGGTGQADTEQTVDDQVPARSGWNTGSCCVALRAEAAVCRRGVGR